MKPDAGYTQISLRLPQELADKLDQWRVLQIGSAQETGKGCMMTEATSAQRIGELAVKLADAALLARERGDDVHALFFAIKAAECLQLAKALGWKPGEKPTSAR